MKVLIALAILLVPLAHAAELQHRVFVSNPDTNGYGYDFKEGVDTADEGELDDKYEFDADQDNFDYLAKALDGKNHYLTNFAFRAMVDGRTSGFAVVYSLTDEHPGPDTKGNGRDTAAFSHSVKLWLKETDGGWRAEIRQVIDESESTLATRTLSGNPNSNQAYAFEYDSSTQQATLRTIGGTVLLQTQAGHDLDGGIGSQWFVGFGFSNINAETILEDPDQSPRSTEIYDLDPRPPELSSVLQAPELVEATQAVTIRTTVTDDWSTPTVKLHHWVNGEPQDPRSMTRSASTYTGQLPGYSKGTVVRYVVTATDSSDLDNSTDTVEYVVGSDEPPRIVGSGGGGGGLLAGNTERGGILAGVALLAVAVGLFFLLQARARRLAIVILLSGVAAALLVAFGGFLVEPIRNASTQTQAIVAIVVAALLLMVLLRRRA